MSDRTHNPGEVVGAIRALANRGSHRWHIAPGDEPMLVLDDGTGDVELRFRPSQAGFRALLYHRDREIERFEIPSADGDACVADGESFSARLDAAVLRALPGPDGDRNAGKTRFLVTFGASQLAGLRESAEREGVAVAEIIRRAVDRYLAARP